MRHIMLICTCLSLVVFSGCGGGGGPSEPAPSAPVVVTVNSASISGNVAWPGATSLAVKVDGVDAPIVNGIWTAHIDFGIEDTKVLDVEIIADSVTVENREITVSR